VFRPMYFVYVGRDQGRPYPMVEKRRQPKIRGLRYAGSFFRLDLALRVADEIRESPRFSDVRRRDS
jgi:hypothetical protein